MADNRYGNQGRERSGSIFSDDDDNRGRRGNRDEWRPEEYGWGGNPDSGRGRGGMNAQSARTGQSGWQSGDRNHDDSDDRGFIARAGDEVRSWFGDDEAERRRERDARRYEQEHGQSGRYQGGGHEDQWTGDSPERADPGRQYSRNQMRSNSGGYGQDDYSRRGSYRGGQGQGYGQSSGQMGGYGQSGQGAGGSHHDESYRRWREQQIQQLDREYDEYCRHRQEQFENDFGSFRQNRQSGITSGGAGMKQSEQGSQTGSAEFSSSSGATGGMGSETGRSQDGRSQAGGQKAGSPTTGSGNASETSSSSGSGAARGSSGGETAGAGSGKSKSR